MNKKFKEKNKLPLTLKYMECFRVNNPKIEDIYKNDYIVCKEYQTDFLMKAKPVKSLTRLL
ncbi:hypothetical protein IX38_20785 [Chryseobacterium luteum]|uniref:Uncharacterized protein n=1 Tax=Chryseobacterium luteum TaxID=421531 RepID=A0A085YYM0_9FLAO|nr:hypothetical protein IX38_20785 [Chryseobacterium luteum]